MKLSVKSAGGYNFSLSRQWRRALPALLAQCLQFPTECLKLSPSAEPLKKGYTRSGWVSSVAEVICQCEQPKCQSIVGGIPSPSEVTGDSGAGSESGLGAETEMNVPHTWVVLRVWGYYHMLSNSSPMLSPTFLCRWEKKAVLKRKTLGGTTVGKLRSLGHKDTRLFLTFFFF